LSDRDEGLFRMLVDDVDSDWPDRLLHNLARAPVVDESVADFARDYATATRTELSEPERRVLHCASLGLEASHIAALLYLSEHTVKTHLKAARFRLKAKNTTHACCLALREGLFE
jgi:DNA-binding NarL/FixJ family response regulator